MKHFITLDQAIKMTTDYRNEKENILVPAHRDQNILPVAEAFDRAPFDTVLAQSGCAGLRIYYGMDEALKIHAIVVGTDSSGNDILPSVVMRAENEGGDEDEGGIIEEGSRCPPLCITSPLNP